MAGKGHEERLPPLTLSARYVIRQETSAGAHGKGSNAPFPDLPAFTRNGEVGTQTDPSPGVRTVVFRGEPASLSWTLLGYLGLS